MEDFVMTRCARSKDNVQDDFFAVTYNNRPTTRATAKNKVSSSEKINDMPSFDVIRRQRELEMKRLRWDVIKFGSSNFDGSMKHKIKVAHAIQLGAKLQKSRKNENYKKLQIKVKWEKAKMERRKNRQSGLVSIKSLKKSRKREEKKNSNDILHVYGKIKKKEFKK